MDTKSLLQEWYWQNGILLLFSPNRETVAHRRQVELLDRHRGGLAERDIIVLEILGDRAVALGGGLGETLETDRLREAFGVAEDAYRMVYVGKDGAEKMRWDEPVEAERLFRTIDATDRPAAGP